MIVIKLEKKIKFFANTAKACEYLELNGFDRCFTDYVLSRFEHARAKINVGYTGYIARVA